MMFENGKEYFVEKILLKNLIKQSINFGEDSNEYVQASRLLSDYRENVLILKETENIKKLFEKEIENRQNKILEIEEEIKKL